MGDLVQVIEPELGLELDAGAPVRGFFEKWLGQQPSPNTRRTYQGAVRAFAAFLGASLEATLVGLLQDRGRAHRMVSAYRAKMLEEERAPSTINLRIAALRSLASFAEQEGHIDWSLKAKGVKAEKYRDTKGPGKAGFLRMLGVAAHPRDKAILWVMYGLALRRSEVVSLDLEHVDLEGARLWVLRKGKRQRKPKTLAPHIVAALRAWLHLRGEEAGALFLNLDRAHAPTRLTDGGVYNILKRLGARAGVQRCHPHGLRHASISEAVRVTQGNMYAVKEFADHSDLKTTAIYVDAHEDKAGEVSALVVADAALEVPS